VWLKKPNLAKFNSKTTQMASVTVLMVFRAVYTVASVTPA